MLRWKPTKIELKIEDKEELEQARQRTAATSTLTTMVLNHIDGSKDPPPPILGSKPSLHSDPKGAGSASRRRQLSQEGRGGAGLGDRTSLRHQAG